MRHAASIIFVAAMIALPLAAEAFVWKWLPRDENSHPDLRTHAERWHDYVRQVMDGLD